MRAVYRPSSRSRHSPARPVPKASLWPYLFMVWGLAYLYALWQGWL